MMQHIVIAGTDTSAGKTVFAAALTAALGASYWKPIQSGLEGETDSETVCRLSGVDATRILPEAYKLRAPLSPHHAAALDGIDIDAAALTPPRTSGPLVIELAGGLMVPLTRTITQIDVLERWKLPVVLVAPTRLGTINHSLLSVEALKTRAIPLLGIAFTGGAADESMRVIGELGRVRILGRLPVLDVVDQTHLARAFAQNFDVGAILGISGGGP